MKTTNTRSGLFLALGLAMTAAASAQTKKPNILVIWGDDIGTWNISHNNRGMMGYKTPNIDRIAKEGVGFTDYYAQQSCTAGRAAFISGSVPVRSGMTKVGMPAAKEGWQKTDVTMATVLKSQGYATGQFGKNHQGDRDEHLPTMHGFDEFFGNLYHLNAEEEPENRDYPGDMKLANGKTFRETFGPRGVLKCKADGKGGQIIEDTGPLTKKRMETVDDESIAIAKDFITRQHQAGIPFFCWWNGTRMHFRTHVKAEHKGLSGKSGDEYHDGMVEHDLHVGQLLKLLDDLGIEHGEVHENIELLRAIPPGQTQEIVGRRALYATILNLADVAQWIRRAAGTADLIMKLHVEHASIEHQAGDGLGTRPELGLPRRRGP